MHPPTGLPTNNDSLKHFQIALSSLVSLKNYTLESMKRAHYACLNICERESILFVRCRVCVCLVVVVSGKESVEW